MNKYYIASVSFGKDSLAMLLYILEHPNTYPLNEVVFFDWGMEFNAIYRLRDSFIPTLQEKKIKFTELHYDTSFIYNFSEREIHKKDGSIQKGYSWCGGRCRWGTDRKNKVIKKYYTTLRSKYDIIEYIGIAADETNRIQRALDNGKILPLVDLGMSEKDALEFCHNHGYFWNESNGIELYDIMDRVSCWCCRNKNKKELKNMYLFLPEYWEKLKHLQNMTDRPMKKYYKNKQEYGTVHELEYIFKQQ